MDREPVRAFYSNVYLVYLLVSIPNELRLRAGGLEFNKQVRNFQF